MKSLFFEEKAAFGTSKNFKEVFKMNYFDATHNTRLNFNYSKILSKFLTSLGLI